MIDCPPACFVYIAQASRPLTGNVSLSNWTMGSALVGLGLNVSQSLGAIIAGNIIVALCVVLTGAPGAKW